MFCGEGVRVSPPWSRKRVVQHLKPIRCRDDHDPVVVRVQPVHARQELVQGLLRLVIRLPILKFDDRSEGRNIEPNDKRKMRPKQRQERKTPIGMTTRDGDRK